MLPVGTGIEHEVVRPDSVLGRSRYRSRPRTGEAPARPLLRHLKPCRRPYPVGPVGAHRQTKPLQEHLNAAVAEAGILSRELLHGGSDGLILRRYLRAVAERGARHRQKRTGSPYRNPAMARVAHLHSAGPRAYHFFALISFITSSSRSRSAASFFNRAFSCSSCRSRRTSRASSCPAGQIVLMVLYWSAQWMLAASVSAVNRPALQPDRQ